MTLAAGLTCPKCNDREATSYSSYCRPCNQARKHKNVDQLCATCGLDRRLSYSTTCRNCHNARKRRWRNDHRERVRTNQNRWQREKGTSYYLKRTYGLTQEEYDILLRQQGGVCAICGKDQLPRRLAVDHSHATGRVRGLLLGQARDSRDTLAMAILYLDRNDG